ncbi:hypothetical protein [Lysinibacillus sp. RC79]|uniref:hypothetical protein n=1 Tax=Lysinibacillus sp. RC79 TaxID=3156296 RepID=UPI0035126523
MLEDLREFRKRIFKKFEEEQMYIPNDREAIDEIEVDGILFKRHLINEDDTPNNTFWYEAVVDNIAIYVSYFRNIVLHEVKLMPIGNNEFSDQIIRIFMKNENLKEYLEYLVDVELYDYEHRE